MGGGGDHVKMISVGLTATPERLSGGAEGAVSVTR